MSIAHTEQTGTNDAPAVTKAPKKKRSDATKKPDVTVVRPVDIDNVSDLIEAAEANLAKLTSLYCYLDGAPDYASGTRGAEMREEFNEAAAELRSCLECIGSDVKRLLPANGGAS